MTKKILLALLIISGSISSALSQTYQSAVTPAQNITAYNQTFTFSFGDLPAGGYGQGHLVVYFDGDFGDNAEFNSVHDHDSTSIGQAGPYASGSDCSGLDSTILSFDASLIDTWILDGMVNFYVSPSGQVDPGNCTSNYVQCRLYFDYCIFGTPSESAAFTITEDRFCNYDDAVTLSGTPPNGTFTGNGVSGNMFNPQGITPGSAFFITYTATDDIGCTTSATQKVYIKRAPNAQDLVTCPGTSAELVINTGGTFLWFEDSGLTQLIDTGNIVASPVIYETTNFYVANLNNTYSFVVDSITVLDSMVVDHDAISGDDRGGIAITPDYIYVVGDNNTVRANASDLSGQISLPIRDALFSDLSNGKLYTLWNTDLNADPNYDESYIQVNSIRSMDENLALGSEINMLSTPFMVDYSSLILAGKGFVGVISSADNHAYIIDLDDYTVQDLGVQNNLAIYGSENWADWGVLEFDEDDFSALYRSYNGSGDQIVRRNLTTGAESILQSFPGGISDLSSFTISPWNNRWYFHYEGNTSTFGGSSETMGYAAAGSTSVLVGSGELGCYTEVEVFVSNIDLGADTTVCQYNTPVVLFAGLGYTSYSWNGVNNNYNAFPATTEGQYIVTATDIYNCTVKDTINVIFDECLGLSENKLLSSMEIFPNPTQTNLSVSLHADINTTVEFLVTDLNGKMLLSEAFTVNSGLNSYELNSSGFAPGMYVIQVKAAGIGTTTSRFVKI